MRFYYKLSKLNFMVNYFKLSKFFLYLVPLSFTIVSNSTLFPFIVGKYAFFRTTVGLALIFYLIGLLFDKQRLSFVNGQLSNVFKRPLIIAVSLFVFIFLLPVFLVLTQQCLSGPILREARVDCNFFFSGSSLFY